MSEASNLPLPGDGSQMQPQPPADALASARADAQETSSPADASCGAGGAPTNSGGGAAMNNRRDNDRQGADRRRRRRALISAPVRVRGVNLGDAENPDEIALTIDVSRSGVLFATSNAAFRRDMEVAVTFPYSKAPGAMQAEQRGRIARVIERDAGRREVAVVLGTAAHAAAAAAPPAGAQPFDFAQAKHVAPGANGQSAAHAASGANGQSAVGAQHAAPVAPMQHAAPGANGQPAASVAAAQPAAPQPLVLAVDADDLVREQLKTYLTGEGYRVIAVNNCADAREVMTLFTPALVIAEVEGEGLPGFDLCAHVKGTPHLRHIPVVLTTRSGYPSDYSNAHSLGAMVCMAKPYKQERLGHVVRLLAPTAEARQQPAPPRPAPKPKAAEPPRRSWFRLS